MSRDEPVLPLVFARAHAAAAGLTAGQVGRRAAHDWIRLRHGWFTGHLLPGEMRWRAEVLAVVRAHRRPLVLSHAHAARAYGWPRPLGGWGPPSFTARNGSTRRRSGIRVAVAGLDDRELELRGAIVLTSPARTVVDCARSLPPHDALAIADAALRQGLTRGALEQALEREAGWPGCRQAEVIVELADGRRETALESWSAWAFHRESVPRPWWQATILDRDGVLLGRADALWEHGVVGEADGRAKYRLRSLERRGVVDAEGLARALDDERRRERELRREGARIVRWEPRDLLDPRRSRRLGEHLHRQLAEAAAEPCFTGRVLLL